ncbi:MULTISPECIES: hypothetical protein [unclassified Pseudomonas]|uniref:hypothetical protein n=1 Tax=unclassified Pseudomonas TaxID=196821 RepID=UPI0021C56F99|nr:MULTISPECIES: hypothetical protein [unclassified Pseudomonas]MCU1735701.1 hypothetical protein [Pseudomonas sp. 20P_3.2_Bac4]MCU1744258.1 hypothetical protein [Pseudomonas sp. 20P_3.2_Bac5]
MRNPLVTKSLLAGLLLVVFAQGAWILMPASRPELSQVVSATPIGESSAVYEVLSNAGGATVPLTYLYFIAPRNEDERQTLKALEQLSPFLVTKQSGAVTSVEGLRVVARTHDQVYSYVSTAVLREAGEVKAVDIELTATRRN